MNLQQAIENAIQKAEGNISEEADSALVSWIRTAPVKEYEEFADACAFAFPEIKNNENQYKVAPGQMVSDYESICLELGIGGYSKQPVPFYRRKIYWAAAAVIIVCITGALYRISNPANGPAIAVQEMPVHQGPELILENGAIVELEGPEIETAAESEFVSINVKDSGSQYLHKPSFDIEGRLEGGYFLVTSPKGIRYDIRLPDGSRVWLNARSSLRYPIFSGSNERRVQLSGEAFFEVQKNERPFIVTTATAETKVLGTRFNVKSYQNEANTKITLLEGSVNVQSKTSAHLLSPGEQAVVTDACSVHKEDTARATAWKRGLFDFKQANLYQILRELERWYNVDIVYNGPVPPHIYTLKASRKVKLEYILLLLKKGGVKTELKGRELKVL